MCVEMHTKSSTPPLFLNLSEVPGLQRFDDSQVRCRTARLHQNRSPTSTFLRDDEEVCL